MLVYILIVILLIIEIILIVKANIMKDKKYYKIFNGFFFGLLGLSIINFIIYIGYLDNWPKIIDLFIQFMLLLINGIIGLVGLVLQNQGYVKNNYLNTSKKNLTLRFFVIIFVIGSIFIASYYFVNYIHREYMINNKTLNYLKEKYGTDEFKILYNGNNYSVNGFITTDELINYYAKVVYVPNNDLFEVTLYVDDDDKIIDDAIKDSFVDDLYGEYFKNDTLIKNGLEQKK